MKTPIKISSLVLLVSSLMLILPWGGSGTRAQEVRLQEYTVKTLYAPPADGQTGGGSYPRVIQLKHYAKGKGDLLVTFSRRPAMPIYRSADDGETWSLLSEITGLSGQPALLELPQQVGEFPAGTVLAAGMAASQEDRSKTILHVYSSADGGRTWAYLSTIAEGGRGIYDAAQRAGDTKETPVWEPFLYLDAAGRLVASYSDERYKADGYNQLLAHRVSKDGGRTWGDIVFDVAVPDGFTRAGMAIVTRLPNGKFFFIYEMVGMPGYALEPRSNPVYFRLSDDGNNFGDFKQVGTLIQSNRRVFLWATPYVVWSPYGGKNGTIIASARATMRTDVGQVGNGVLINRNLGEGLWTLVETPIRYTPGPGGYSRTMIPLGDGREILEIVPVDGHIRYAKFRLPE